MQQTIHPRMILLVVLVAVGSLLGCSGNNKVHATQLTVVTYNIHAGVGMDKKLDLARIASVIRACEPDFVALQEVDKGTKRSGGVDQAAELAKLTNMHAAYGAAMPFNGGEYGDAVLSRWPITSSRVVVLPWKEGNQREPRGAVSATTTLPGKAGVIQFISTHFDHTREPSDRLAQARAINSGFRQVRHPGLRPVILAGDFNCEVGSEAMNALAGEWTLVSGADPAAPTCCGAEPKVKIDHVFVQSPKFGRWRVAEARVVDERVASDHRPVLVKLELLP